MFRPVLGETLVVVSDAHLGHAPPQVETALLDFLDQVPELGDCLLLNGDLFEFWFAYDRVIPRTGFRVAAALGQLRRRMPVLMVGGNHDRWGRAFWKEELGLTFSPDRLEFQIGRRRVLALHGDRIGYGRPRSRFLHGLVSSRAASAVYRWLHPELGFPLVYGLSARLGDHATHGAIVERSVERQREWAEHTLEADPSLGLVILGHTHRALVESPRPGQQLLNPGAWFDGFRYAIASADGAELRQFTPAVPLPLQPPPTARR